MVFQMKHASSQAQVSRVSIAAVFAQSLLDANLCMVHLLLSFAFPSIFFASFIWIAIIKLMLFSVFQMRLIVNIYQARCVAVPFFFFQILSNFCFPCAFNLMDAGTRRSCRVRGGKVCAHA